MINEWSSISHARPLGFAEATTRACGMACCFCLKIWNCQCVSDSHEPSRPPALILARDFITKSSWHGLSFFFLLLLLVVVVVVVVVAVVQLPLCWPCSSNPKMSRKSWTLLDRLLVVEPERRLGANRVQEADFSIGSTHTEGLYIVYFQCFH